MNNNFTSTNNNNVSGQNIVWNVSLCDYRQWWFFLLISDLEDCHQLRFNFHCNAFFDWFGVDNIGIDTRSCSFLFLSRLTSISSDTSCCSFLSRQLLNQEFYCLHFVQGLGSEQLQKEFDSRYYHLHSIQGLGGERLKEEFLPSFSLQFGFFLLQHSIRSATTIMVSSSLQILTMTDNLSVVVSYPTKDCEWSQTEPQLALLQYSKCERLQFSILLGSVWIQITISRVLSNQRFYRLHPFQGSGNVQLNKEFDSYENQSSVVQGIIGTLIPY